ncbi:hypothetical protein JX265_013019 [Neoarthrinium moseri]|uniref:Uncharacterized protein n=1 Tax=Neoarthrinium moseri TaxID=1658444 RepID=A0A9P9W9E6_9PEZI|nr:hypothetical protein JX265_013019 [Neoarthrinium moseri]KAI1853088.1 hypothetical protein JX266_001794 [Neoarthrinium moseri]
MYAGNYGFPNGAPPSQNPHMPGSGQGPNPNQPPQQQQQHQQHQQHQQQQQQQQQQMMYNPQQFPMGPQGPGFPGGPNVNMMPGAGATGGMMQNSGMAHMAAANGQMPNYQTPYSNSPYGAGIPSSVAPQMNMPPNYAVGGNMPMSGFQMHPGQMTPQQQQQMMQRMQPPQQQNTGGMSSNTPQRQFPGQGQTPGPQGTPTPTNSLPSQQPQFSTPQPNQGTPQSQTPNNAPQQPQPPPMGNNIQTPQTPTFPSNVQGAMTNGASNSAPMSPGGDSKDKDRIGVILEINNELLWECTQIQNTTLALKNERGPPKDGAANDQDKTDEEKTLLQELSHCMRRLQGNLAYLAQLADKKTSGQAAPHPNYMKPPPLSTKVKIKPMAAPDGTEGKIEPTDREETVKYFNHLYTKLQNLYPGVDYNKEPAPQQPGARPGAPQGHKPGGQPSNQASPVPGNQRTPQMTTSGAPQPQVGHPAANSLG